MRCLWLIGALVVSATASTWDKIRGPEGTYVILQWATPEEAAKD
jgi:hypothetical protein